ncbi:MAG TPA: alpha/beta hydrolase-fold protein, partial [Ktedonobacteraceae bacterium]|nr:alpha/beta hydrolase-fold protein [Ktedonobacteraceae bacterium]
RTPQGQKKHYPVLYLLHGSPGQPKDWLNGGEASQSADTLIATGQIPELLLVIPDGNGRPGATPEWANSFDQRQRLETYVTSDLIPYVDKHYRTIPDAAHRGLAGLSMGGFGAMNIAVHHPNLFGWVISLGGYYQAEATNSIWGHNAAYIRANSPLFTIQHTPAAWKLHIYLGAATLDQPYYKDTQQFMAVLDKLHIPYHFDLQKGYHSWRIWQIQIYHAYTWLKWG